MKNDIEKLKEELYNLVVNGSHIITDENKNVWNVIETSDLKDILNSIGGDDCSHPREKRVYIGKGMLKCALCGEEFN